MVIGDEAGAYQGQEDKRNDIFELLNERDRETAFFGNDQSRNEST